MLIVWGKKPVRKKLGFLADFCPICRQVSLLRATSIGRVSHFYFVPLGRAERLVNECVCQDCKTVFGVHPGTALITAKKPGSDLLAFALQTSPRGSDGLTRRMELEVALEEGRIDADQRRWLIEEPVRSLVYAAEQEAKEGTARSISSLLQVMMLVALVGAGIVWAVYFSGPRPPPGVRSWAFFLTAATAVLVPLVIYREATHDRRSVRRVLRRLVRSLAALTPSADEIEGALAPLRPQRAVIARGLSGREVSDAIAAHGLRPRS